MKTKTRFPILLLLVTLIAMLSLTACGSYSPVKGSLVMGENYLLQSGDSLNDDLTIMGGNAKLENGSTINGDVSVLGGTLDVDGTVNGDISVLGGSVHLNDNAVVHGSISQIGGSVTRSKTARVDGSMNRSSGSVVPPAPIARPPRINLAPIFAPFLAIFRALALAALAILVFLFAGRPMERVVQSVQNSPVVTGGIGLLSLIVIPALLIILGITIILLPVSILGVLLVAVAVVFGWLAMGLLTGQRIARLLNQRWSDALNAGVGTLVLTLLASVFNVIPCVGWLATFMIGMIGLGAVIVTRFGSQVYPPLGGGSFRPAPAVAPASPAGPAPTSQQGPANQESYAPGYYYAPHVVNPNDAASTLGVEPANSTVAPDLDFPGTDTSETDQAGENKPVDEPPAAQI